MPLSNRSSTIVAVLLLLAPGCSKGDRRDDREVVETSLPLLLRLDRARQVRGFPDDRRFLGPLLDPNRNFDRDEIPFAMPPDGAVDFPDVPLHREARLAFGYGYDGTPNEERSEGGVEFRVLLLEDGGGERLLFSQRRAAEGPGLWRAEVPIEGSRAGAATLRFETRPFGAALPGGLWPVFASPVVRSRGVERPRSERPVRAERLVADFLSRFAEDRARMEESDDWEWVVHTPTEATCFAVKTDLESGEREIVPITASGFAPAMTCDGRPGAPGGGARPALFFQDDQEILRSEVDLPAEGTLELRFAVGVDERCVGVGSADFEVRVAGETVFRETLDPELRPSERGWRERRVDISRFAGRRVTISFRGAVGFRKERVLRREEPVPLGPPRPVEWRVRRVMGGFARPRVVALRERPRRSASRDRPSVVLVNVETLRADEVGPGAEGTRTPHIDALSAEGLTVSPCVAVAPWTSPSVASLFTGRYPLSHGVVSYARSFLPDAAVTIAEQASLSGVTTAAFVTNDLISRAHNYDQGFETFFEAPYANARQVTALFEDWLADHSSDQFLAYLHLFEPHHPYNAPPPDGRRDVPPELEGLDADAELARIQDALLRGRSVARDDRGVRLLRALYRGEIRYLDRQIGRLVEALERAGLRGRVVLILTGDHGEEFLEHGLIGHGSHVYGESVEVPLVLWGPGIVPHGRVGGPVENARLFSVVRDLLGVEEPLPEGALAGFALEPGRAGRPAYVHTAQGIRRIEDRTGLRPRIVTCSIHSIRTPEAALQRIPGESGGEPGRTLLFDLAADPEETRDVSSERPGLRVRLEELLRAAHRFATRRRIDFGPGSIDPEKARTLRALGYLSGVPSEEDPLFDGR